MCGNADIELSNMPRSFLVKKNNSYSHCPLKKRPLTYFLQQSEDDVQVESPLSDSSLMNDEEPENLSLKPEDRYLAAERERKRLLGNPEVYSPPAAHQESVKSCPSPLIEVKLSTGPLEPLNLNNYHQGSLYGLSRPSVTAVPYSYAPYLPFNLTTFNSYATQTPVPHYPISAIQHAEQLSPFAPRDSISPPGLSPATVTSTSPTSQTSDHSDVEDLSSPSLSPAKRRKTSATRFQCPDCHKSYSTYCGLTKHQELHCSQQTKKSFSCKHCDKVYVSLGALKMHIRTHTLPCKCMLCGKAFSRPWLLQGHIRTHTGEKPFSCQHCSRSFADRSNLRAHLQTHSDVKRYSCKACGKTFSRMSLLTKHEDGGCPGIVFKRDAA